MNHDPTNESSPDADCVVWSEGTSNEVWNAPNATIQPCIGWLGRIFGHRFQARYSTEERENPEPFRVEEISGVAARIFTESLVLTNRTYHHDICERCGAVRKRNP